MRILVLGGTVFLSKAVAAEAAARGHDVTCAARGASGRVPEGARLVRLDRTHPDWSSLAEQTWDAVVDVARYPSWVRAALQALEGRTRSWVFVSTCSVYAYHATPGADASATVLPAADGDSDETDPELYGELKVASEQVVRQHCDDAALLVRPGLIVGPGDPSGRFAYWPNRMAEAATTVGTPRGMSSSTRTTPCARKRLARRSAVASPRTTSSPRLTPVITRVFTTASPNW